MRCTIMPDLDGGPDYTLSSNGDAGKGGPLVDFHTVVSPNHPLYAQVDLLFAQAMREERVAYIDLDPVTEEQA